ncbi:MAG TPA: Smr/MutS family protein [Rhizomicrobium sp.]|nr:Smr/MutS family protein [Rhizomicrobium sp.]
MTKKRPVSEEERALFETAFREATPIAPALMGKKALPQKSKPTPGGVNGRTAERLKRGEIEPEARLDLHGMTERAAYGALATFIRSAWSRGLKLVIVVTGKGARAPEPDAPFEMDSRRGVLRDMAPRWLKEPELASLVADVRFAHRSHGGEGALYVYLRKNR